MLWEETARGILVWIGLVLGLDWCVCVCLVWFWHHLVCALSCPVLFGVVLGVLRVQFILPVPAGMNALKVVRAGDDAAAFGRIFGDRLAG